MHFTNAAIAAVAAALVAPAIARVPPVLAPYPISPDGVSRPAHLFARQDDPLPGCSRNSLSKLLEDNMQDSQQFCAAYMDRPALTVTQEPMVTEVVMQLPDG